MSSNTTTVKVKQDATIRNDGSVYLGCDPEFFFTKKGRIIGCERIIPTDGVAYREGMIIIDGVQAEINPQADTCRQRLANKIAQSFALTEQILSAHKDSKDLSISLDTLVDIDKVELGDLSDKAKYFGCTPSKNIYDEKNIMPIKDSSKYYKRSAGGHIHLGFGNPKLAHDNARNIVAMLDIIVGNTCVLFDRHEGNAERRKLYGRAGEYRLPKHGIEYRTVSNFWLRDYKLMSGVFGLARLAVRILDSSDKVFRRWEGSFGHETIVEYRTPDFAQQIFDAVDLEKVRQAINENDFDLAMENFMRIKPILERIVPDDGTYPLDRTTIPYFLYFVNKGVDHFFGKLTSEKVFASWRDNLVSLGAGWENFLRGTVRAEMLAEEKKA